MKPLPHIDTIIFDAGGVLFYIDEFRKSIVERVLHSLGYDAEIINLALKEVKAIDCIYCSDVETIVSWTDEKEWLEKRYSKIAEIVDPGNADLKDKLYFLAFDTFQYKLYDETVEILNHLKDKYELVVLSNATASLDWAFDFLDIRKYFSHVIISSYEKCAKPDKKIYELTLERINKTPHQCIFIDDKIENVKAAQKMGISGYHLDRKKGMNLGHFVASI